MAFALKARRHRKHTLDDPPYMIDPIHHCVLFIPFGQIFLCGHMDNYDPMVTVIYLHLWWSCFFCQSCLQIKVWIYLSLILNFGFGFFWHFFSLSSGPTSGWSWQKKNWQSCGNFMRKLGCFYWVYLKRIWVGLLPNGGATISVDSQKMT